MGDEERTENNPADALEDDQVTLESQREEAAAGAGGEPQSALLGEIEALKTELVQAKEQALRAAAEAQNIRRRAEQDVAKAHKFALEKFVADMVPVADNLERAIAAASAEGADLKAVVEGVELTLKTLLDGLNRHRVDVVDPVGEPFNPELHQAMSMVSNADVEPNTVLNVFQKGYTLNGRLVRPAMVVVAKAVEENAK